MRWYRGKRLLENARSVCRMNSPVLPIICTLMSAARKSGSPDWPAPVERMFPASTPTTGAWNRAPHAQLVAGGGKGCFWGCLGIGDCQVACTFDAIEMNSHRLPVVNESRCTACGDCVTACPKDLFTLEPQSHRLWVACRSQEAGDEILDDCQVACTACGRCAMDAPGLVEMQGNLPVIHYSQGPATALATERCPTGAIVWLDALGTAVKGQSARKIIRESELPDAPT